jgi:hypothetical protein
MNNANKLIQGPCQEQYQARLEDFVYGMTLVDGMTSF